MECSFVGPRVFECRGPEPEHAVPANEACRNCGALLTGEWCAACGQKRFVEADRRLANLLAQAFELLTDLDGRLWGTLRALAFRPGLLDRDYIAGRRRRWLPPLSLFLLANVVYFMAPLRAAFDLSFASQVPGPVAAAALGDEAAPGIERFPGQLHRVVTTGLVERVVAQRDARERASGGEGYTLAQLRRDYDAIAGDVSKALLVLHVPFVALLLMAALAGTRRYYAEHVVVTLHFFAMLVPATLAFGQAVRWIQQYAGPRGAVTALSLLFLGALAAWTWRQVARGYGVGRGRAALGALALLAGTVLVNVVVYRALQFTITLWLS